MSKNEFHLKWERDEKFNLKEQIENKYDEALWAEATRLYQDDLAAKPNHPEYLFSYGFLLEMKANRLLREAAECYKKGVNALADQPEFAWISGKLQAQLIKVRNQLSENHISINDYKQRLSESPDDPSSYCFLIQCYLNMHQLSEAKKVVEAGIKLFPDNAMMNYYEGEIRSRLGHIEEALQAWAKSAELDPQLIDGRFSRAFLLEREQRYAEAADEWEQIVAFMERYNLGDEYPRQEQRRLRERADHGKQVG